MAEIDGVGGIAQEMGQAQAGDPDRPLQPDRAGHQSCRRQTPIQHAQILGRIAQAVPDTGEADQPRQRQGAGRDGARPPAAGDRLADRQAQHELQEERAGEGDRQGIVPVVGEAGRDQQHEQPRHRGQPPALAQQQGTAEDQIEEHLEVEGPAERQQRVDAIRLERVVVGHEQERQDDVAGRQMGGREQTGRFHHDRDEKEREQPVGRHDPDHAAAPELAWIGRARLGRGPHDEAADHEEEVDPGAAVQPGRHHAAGQLGQLLAGVVPDHDQHRERTQILDAPPFHRHVARRAAAVVGNWK